MVLDKKLLTFETIFDLVHQRHNLILKCLDVHVVFTWRLWNVVQNVVHEQFDLFVTLLDVGQVSML